MVDNYFQTLPLQELITEFLRLADKFNGNTKEEPLNLGWPELERKMRSLYASVDNKSLTDAFEEINVRRQVTPEVDNDPVLKSIIPALERSADPFVAALVLKDRK